MYSNNLQVHFINEIGFEETIYAKEGDMIKTLIGKLRYAPKEVYAVIINNRLHSIYHKVEADCECRFVTYSSFQGRKMYEATLKFLFYTAMRIIYPNVKFKCANKMGADVLIHLRDKTSDIDISKVVYLICDIIASEADILSKRVRREKLIEIYANMGHECKLDVNNPFEDDYKVSFFNYDGKVYYNYLYERLLPNTSMLHSFRIERYNGDILIRMPTARSSSVCNTEITSSKCFELFNSNFNLEIEYLSDLNHKVINSEGINIIRLAEEAQTMKFVEITESILSKEARLIFIAGPSSSGKTTSAMRIEEMLKLQNKKVLRICMDDFFKDYIDSPVDRHGNRDFDSINHFDIDCFKSCIEELFEGREVVIPRYDFSLDLGKKVYDRSKVKIDNNTYVIIEGIHGLNPIISNLFNYMPIFKIYLSPMVTLNYDDFTKVSSNLSRLTRRIVRDYLTRGCNLERTFDMWEKVKKGEMENIWPYVDSADYILNTSLIYEMCVLRPYAEKILKTVNTSSKWYYLAKQMYQMLQRFESLESNFVPTNSLLREFIGGSCYDY